MFSEVFLAATSSEIKNGMPKRAAYMACRFSPSGTGLTNLPTELPENSLLMLDDSMQIAGHEPEAVTRQLCKLVEEFSPLGVLLDFQRPVTPESAEMGLAISRTLPCPVAATEDFARIIGCPVFLSACPVNKPLEKFLQPWRKQEIYLEIAPSRTQISVTEKGAEKTFLPAGETESLLFQDCQLYCHYKTEVLKNRAIFTLQRNRTDLEKLIAKAKDLGVTATVGLYQELSGLI